MADNGRPVASNDDRVVSAAPQLRDDWALFLDIDGTLLDIAETPDDVVVPEDLAENLTSISRRLSGALALVSGRSLDNIDALMTPFRFPCAAEHGAALRFPDGSMQTFAANFAVPEAMRVRLRDASERFPGVIVEEKAFNVVLHFRRVPARADDIRAFADGIVEDCNDRFEILPARMAFEIRHADMHKGAAIRAFMKGEPFAGRTPVFVGDDATDEDGFGVVRELGGLALEVPQLFDNEPANVREWLRRCANPVKS